MFELKGRESTVVEGFAFFVGKGEFEAQRVELFVDEREVGIDQDVSCAAGGGDAAAVGGRCNGEDLREVNGAIDEGTDAAVAEAQGEGNAGRTADVGKVRDFDGAFAKGWDSGLTDVAADEFGIIKALDFELRGGVEVVAVEVGKRKGKFASAKGDAAAGEGGGFDAFALELEQAASIFEEVAAVVAEVSDDDDAFADTFEEEAGLVMAGAAGDDFPAVRGGQIIVRPEGAGFAQVVGDVTQGVRRGGLFEARQIHGCKTFARKNEGGIEFGEPAGSAFVVAVRDDNGSAVLDKLAEFGGIFGEVVGEESRPENHVVVGEVIRQTRELVAAFLNTVDIPVQRFESPVELGTVAVTDEKCCAEGRRGRRRLGCLLRKERKC